MSMIFLTTFVATFLAVNAQFSIPEIQIQAITPFGFKASIQALPGIKLFGFHAKITNVDGKDGGQLDGDVTEVTGNRFIFEDKNIKIVEGDTINYWVFVQYESIGYRKDDQVYQVLKLVAPGTPFIDSIDPIAPSSSRPPTCEPSMTTINNGKSTCRGHLIFEESFTSKTIDSTKWKIEQKLPSSDQENEFVSYQKMSVSVSGNALTITPMLLHRTPSFNEDSITSGVLDLTLGCTANLPDQCYINADEENDILPPIISGKITTKNLFSFKYGKIEVKAKLPQGDWIYPELYLLPLDLFYGSTGFSSGVIRIAFARGNLELNAGGVLYDNSVLSGGVILSQFDPCRTEQGMKENPLKNSPWGSNYHVYGIVWKEDSIQISVDGKVYGTILPVQGGFKKYDSKCKEVPFELWKRGNKLAPFDKEFYISLGLGVGGVSDFPDNVGGKPWINKRPTARRDFWNKISNVTSSWNSNSNLLIDSIKVWAI